MPAMCRPRCVCVPKSRHGRARRADIETIVEQDKILRVQTFTLPLEEQQ